MCFFWGGGALNAMRQMRIHEEAIYLDYFSYKELYTLQRLLADCQDSWLLIFKKNMFAAILFVFHLGDSFSQVAL